MQIISEIAINVMKMSKMVFFLKSETHVFFIFLFICL